VGSTVGFVVGAGLVGGAADGVEAAGHQVEAAELGGGHEGGESADQDQQGARVACGVPEVRTGLWPAPVGEPPTGG
jgi:hypothetical protein